MNPIDDFKLRVDERIIDAGVNVGFLLCAGVENRMRHKYFIATRRALLRDLVDNAALADVIGHPFVKGYRELHRRFCVDDPSLVPSPESLYALLFKRGDLKSINPIVDIYNYVALKHRLSCGAHDIDRLSGAIQLRPTTGDEPFKPLGKSTERPVPEGEYAYIDGAGRVICRLECKQADHSAVAETTRNVAIIVQGNACTPLSFIEEALSEITSLVRTSIGEPEVLRRVSIPSCGDETKRSMPHGAYA